MTEKRITSVDVDDAALRELYESAFPVEEQIPWRDLMQLTGTMPLDFTACYDGGQLLGFTIVYPRRSFNWFWYFAVPEPLRGKGVGQTILGRMLRRYDGQTIILDMESPLQACDNIAQRRRRHEYYLRNGFRDTGVERSFGPVTMTIMIRGEGTFTPADYDEILAELRAAWRNMPQ